ncbi:hypothetical protein J21TS7_10740 [Paenibacillus cineris]|uniref:Uncharacterized protein n=1 Tax=Paenibacillus cineris TaxID=237530 RepID=A0ABQ4L839_9BACL|nr:hypothetical protein J21TS7_10740 [Paenibacillus cineris]
MFGEAFKKAQDRHCEMRPAWLCLNRLFVLNCWCIKEILTDDDEFNIFLGRLNKCRTHIKTISGTGSN